MSATLQDRVMIFHNYADCPGIITSKSKTLETPEGAFSFAELICAECGLNVGTIDPGALEQLIELAEKGGAKKSLD